MRQLQSGLAKVIISGLLFAGAAQAQTPPQNPQNPPAAAPQGVPMPMPMMGMGGGMMPMMGMGGGMMPMMGMMMTRPEGYFAFLKTEIGITEAQNNLWTAFTDQMRPLMKQHLEVMQKMQASGAKPLTWIERLTAMQSGMNAHLEAMKKMVPAATALYAGLTPEQKTKADALMPGGMSMRMNMGMMGAGMMGGGGMPGGK